MSSFIKQATRNDDGGVILLVWVSPNPPPCYAHIDYSPFYSVTSAALINTLSLHDCWKHWLQELLVSAGMDHWLGYDLQILCEAERNS